MSARSEKADGVPEQSGAPALALRRIGKAFGQVKALARVDLAAYPGEIHFIVGDNGAGKSTTLKILSGIYQADEGEVLIHQQPVHMRDASEAHRHGIAVVHQDLALVECLDVATNMALGAIPRRGRFMLDRARMERDAAEVLANLKIRVGSVRTQIGLLSGGERQIVAIARAVRMNLPIILLDEPTAALGVRETAHVGDILDELRRQGKTVICISHDLEFVFAHADRITVMRLGNSVATLMRRNTTRDEVVGMITGTIEALDPERAGAA
ncbi:ATP-binding cassette domain-containing protein [Mesorhizobium sp. BR1-1-16]|uniref:ATP-binding cassette domain-containing protein n=1 Tax=Mesorhizobium sp. BR1-1-16 TaxID=2876653 RepID=UPI001CCC70D2|nr:ATP-binding cassette domain-containing protein [Mesorhizobium sp. BR1-1-16]MBZ9935280.1 ATP-binding cassette domain-containing protein [Mesorhizobium sp. BR1-1-16]